MSLMETTDGGKAVDDDYDDDPSDLDAGRIEALVRARN